jgi:hypothetical protein
MLVGKRKQLGLLLHHKAKVNMQCNDFPEVSTHELA